MYLQRLLQLNMAVMATLGALLLGMGERSVAPPLMVAVAAALSTWLTDLRGVIQIGKRTSNVLMLAAAVYALSAFYSLGNEMQALNFARLLVYLQIILMFQRKDDRIHWLLVMLSLLQVVVAALFSQGAWFGLLLAGYMMLGFSAMHLLLMHRLWQRHQPHGDGKESEIQAGEFASRPSAAGKDSSFQAFPAGAADSGLGGVLYRRLGVMGLQTLGLTVVLFFALPRLGQVAWRGPIVQPQPMVGFTDAVKLGELGQIIESREEVMRVKFFQYPGEKPQPIRGEFYLQGALLLDYDNGQWRASDAPAGLGTEQLTVLRSRRPPGLTSVEIAIGAMDRDELFFIAPYVPIKSNAEIDIDYCRQRLLRTSYRRRGRFVYTLGTTAFVDGVQRPLVPWNIADQVYRAKAKPPVEGPRGLPRLTALAAEWIKQSGLPPEDRLGRARYIEHQLSSSGRFQYSLVGQKRDPRIDPIEDFIANNPRGHCEYFATALALMLRSQNIPARMVSGFKCDQGDWNELGKYYQVRQYHAHTWVEVFLNDRQLAKHPELLHGGDYWPWLKRDNGGGWVRLDPTPAGAAAAERRSWLSPIRRAQDWVDAAWSNYVMELDCQRQRDAIYQPIAKFVKDLWREAANPRRWRSMFNSLAVAMYLDHLGREVQWLLAAVAAALLAVVLSAAVWLVVRFVRRRLVPSANNHRRRRRKAAAVEFYRRFEVLLARRGLVRAAGQTQREFAAAAGLRLAASTGEPRWKFIPDVIADAFYRVRFGRVPLDSRQAEAVEQALAELAATPKSNI
jgi:transglutaminase-like putative cysteine protease